MPGGVGQDDVYRFLAAWSRKHEVLADRERRAWLSVGDSGWTMPVPIVRVAQGWRFDPAAGKAEIARRAIGRRRRLLRAGEAGGGQQGTGDGQRETGCDRMLRHCHGFPCNGCGDFYAAQMAEM